MRKFLLLIFIVSLIALNRASLRAAATAPRKIAYYGYSGKALGVYEINEDGSTPVRIAPAGAPVWSPDGERIAFSGLGPDRADYGMYVVNNDGSNIRRLPYDEVPSSPVWSPDGKYLAYSIQGVPHQVVVEDVATGKATTLTKGGSILIDWLPDSQYIIFDWQDHLDVIGVDGSDQEVFLQLTVPLAATHLHLSPDGQHVAGLGLSYASKDPTIRSLVLIEQAGMKILVDTHSIGSQYAWTPDSKRLIFSMREQNVSQIFSINADGTDLRALTSGDGDKFNPSVSSDGAFILFDTTADPEDSNRLAHTLPKATAIELIQAQKRQIGQPYTGYAYRSAEGEFRFWLVASTGKTYIADKSTFQEITANDASIGALDTDGIPAALGAFVRIKGADLLKYTNVITGVSFQAGTSVLNVVKLSLKGTIEVQRVLPKYTYDATADTFKDNVTEDLYRAGRNGYVSGQGADQILLPPFYMADGDNEIYIMNVDGSDVRRLTTDGVPKYRPALQPAG